MNRLLVPLLVALLGALPGCSGPEDVLADAGAALRAGRLDAAEALVAPLEGDEAEAFRTRLAAARDHRAAVRAGLEALQARVPAAERKEVFAALEALAKAEKDPVLDEEISYAKSRIYDAYASSSRVWSRGPDRKGSTKPPPFVPDPTPPAEPDEDPPAARVADTDPPPRDDAPERDPPAGPDPDPVVGEPSPVVDAPPAPATAEEFERLAHDHLAQGELAAAHEALLAAAGLTTETTWRTAVVEEARHLEDRLRLRRELAAAFADDAAPFTAFGCEGIDVDAGLSLDERIVPWGKLSLELWNDLRRTTPLSTRAELGFLGERLARGDERSAWLHLRRLLRDERIEEHEAFALIARQRGETVPDDGYVYDGRDWVAAEVAADRAREVQIANLLADFAKAEGEERDTLFDEFLYEDFEAELRTALQARWDSLAKRFDKSSGGSRLRELATRREELDRRRTAALELIFDEEEYFYPYNPPACPPERAKLYPAVQRRVDVLVGEVREVWKDDFEVALRGELRDLVDEAQWLVRREDEWGKASILPDEFPYWVLALDLRLDAIGLREFAWDEEERDDLARSRAVRARNRDLWERGELPPEGREAATAERRQVEVTNDYRLLLGRRAVAWNPLIQAAAYDHSQYMADTGDFGHTEPDPERKGPGERMKRRGYDRGAGENCHGGGGDPMGAHVAWCHSSGHHRNLLGRGHTEMASGLVGSYWTQNFGSDESFLEELSAWSD